MGVLTLTNTKSEAVRHNMNKMWSSKITFKSLNNTLSFLVESENQELIESFVYGLYEILGDTETKKIDVLQKNDSKTKKKIEDFVVRFKDKFPPSINQITAYFRRLSEDESFLFLPNIDLTIQNSNKLYNYLLSLKGEESFEKLNKEFETTIGNTLNNYNLRAFGGFRTFIGDKNNRKCRFCGKKNDETTFKNKAHAISEGLGNKKVFLFDECDECNERFSIEIEPDLINYFSIFRTFYEIKGKGGNKKIKGKNFEISKGKNVEIKFQSIKSRPNIDKDPNKYNLKLELQDKINLQDIYRGLAKFCISVMDESEVAKFYKTITWINKDFKVEKLPQIGELISYQHFTTEPKLFLYIRKNNNKKIPYMVGEFHLTCKLLTFIMPLCEEDEYDFTEKNNFDDFWNEFNHYSKVKGWVFNDYSSDKEKKFIFNLNMNKRKNE